MEISRAIELLEHLSWDRDIDRNPYGDALNMAIEALKAQLSKENTTKDAISRQQAIDALMAAIDDVGVLDGADIKVVFDNLPPAQPEPTYEQVEEYCKKRCLHVVTADFFESTKPQRLGHWIQYDKRFPWRHHYKCSECGNYLDFTGVNGGRGEANYCPNCGAKMTISTK